MSAKPPAWCQRNIEIMPESVADRTFDRASVLKRCSPRWSGANGYTACWAEGAPLGNGDFGAMVYGGPENLTFLLGKNDLWLRSMTKSLFPGSSFRALLDIVRRGDKDEFSKLLPADPYWCDDYRPSTLLQAGMLRLHLAEASAARHMTQELRLEDATWHALFEAEGLDNMWAVPPDFEIEAFVSIPDEVLAIRIRRHRLPLRAFTWRLGRETHELLPPPETDANGNLAWLDQQLVQGDRYALAVLQDGLSAELTPTLRSVLGEIVSDAKGSEAIFYVAAATQLDSADPLDLACERVKAAAQRGFDALHADHAACWDKFWSRSWLTCSEPKVEKAWYVSNYLAGSTERPGKMSPGLQGMWCKENFPPWSADFHGNVNIQAIYQGIMGSNHADLFEPYAALYARMRPQCRRDTETYFGLPGVRYPHAGGVDGHEMTEPNYLVLATSYTPSAWIARLFWWEYEHTGDQEFLRDVAYPVLRDVAEFYQGILELSGNEADGRVRIELAIWGEQDATNFNGYGVNSSYDIGAFMAAFQQARDAARILGLADDAARWDRWHAALPDMPADEEDIWLKWQDHPCNGRFTAHSFFHPVVPCEIASAYHGPEQLRRQARASWRHAAASTPPLTWCGGTPTAAAVLMGDMDWAWRSLAAGISNNGLNCGVAQGLMQADHGTGFAFGINTAAVARAGDAILLFGGISPEIDFSFHSLRIRGAVLVSAAQKAGRVIHAAFQSLRGGKLCVLNPFNPIWMNGHNMIGVRVIGDDGSAMDAGVLEHHARIEWQAKAGVLYRLETV